MSYLSPKTVPVTFFFFLGHLVKAEDGAFGARRGPSPMRPDHTTQTHAHRAGHPFIPRGLTRDSVSSRNLHDSFHHSIRAASLNEIIVRLSPLLAQKFLKQLDYESFCSIGAVLGRIENLAP
jgi:hypothetical protein